MESGTPIPISHGFQLRHRISIPVAPSDGAFILGDRVRVRGRRDWRREAREGVVIAINLAWHEVRTPGYHPTPRPYQVVLDECPRKVFRFGAADLELTS